jgi:hypothetical protein
LRGEAVFASVHSSMPGNDNGNDDSRPAAQAPGA